MPAIEACLREQEYETIACASVFASDLSGSLETLITTSESLGTDASVVDLLRLAVLDLEPPRHTRVRGATGVKYLVRRRS